MLKVSKAFTLAEIMIVLTVIGVLSAILLPVAIHSSPDENVMKFKKANSTLGTVIRELVNSDEYYLNGDLGKKANGNWVLETDYFCNTFSDVISTKEVKCIKKTTTAEGFAAEDWELNGTLPYSVEEYLDKSCKNNTNPESYIVASDDTTYYESTPECVFGNDFYDNIAQGDARKKIFYWKWNKGGIDSSVYNQNGFYYIYKPFCIDVDGLNKGEDPFGYGIRVDGKILYGKRAQEWTKKSVQKED